MAYDKAIDSIQLDADLKSIADAIRAKGETIEQLVFPTGFISAINALQVIPPAPAFEWGDELAVGDSTWWNGLKGWIIGVTKEERQAMLGKTKRVSLSTPVLGSNQVIMRCIGIDQDGSKTLTFAAVSALAQNNAFGSNSAVWIDSLARTKCQEFYDTCSAKDAIKTVVKGTCPDSNNSRNGAPTYNNETVFLMSERELGLDELSPISTANSNPDRAECTKGYNASYQYFTGDDKRIFYLGNANGDAIGNPVPVWQRSRWYYNGNPKSLCILTSSGKSANNNYNAVRAVLPAFAVGE